MLTRRPVLLAFILILIALLACSFGAASTTVPEQALSSSVAAIAFHLDGDRNDVHGFVGPGTFAWDLDPGSYTIHAINQSGMYITFAGIQIVDVPLIWPADFRTAGGVIDPARAAAITALADFLVQAQLVQLAALEHSSAGFTVPLFSNQPDQAALDDLYARYASILGSQDVAISAMDSLTQAGKSGQTPSKTAAPASDWKESLVGFFGYAGNAGARARDRILAIAEDMSPEDQADAFEVIRDGFKSQASDFDELAAQLQSGQLDERAAQIESDMRNSPGFAAAAQQANATVGQVVHREGGELIVKGAELQVEVVKHVLGQAFPDISQGFELADKGSEWLEYLESVYRNPLLATEGDLRDAAQEAVKDRILEQLRECCGALDEDIAEDIADSLSEEAMASVPSVIEGIQATQTALAAQPAPGEAPLEGASSLRLTGTFHEDLEIPDVSEVDFSAELRLAADLDAGRITGTIIGAGTYNVSFDCDSERGVATYALDYTAEVDSSLPTGGGEFSASYAPVGMVSFVEMAQPFGSSDCADMNADLNVTFPFVGGGTIRGMVNPDGSAEMTTEWSFLELGTMSGNWAGVGAEQAGP